MNFVGTLKPRERQGGIQAIMLAQVQEPISGPGYLNIFFIMPIRALPAARLYAHTAQALATGRYPLQSLTRFLVLCCRLSYPNAGASLRADERIGLTCAYCLFPAFMPSSILKLSLWIALSNSVINSGDRFSFLPASIPLSTTC